MRLTINVEMNIENSGKTKNSSLAMDDLWSPYFTCHHLVGHLGWEPLPEIRKMATITHRVNTETWNKNRIGENGCCLPRSPATCLYDVLPRCLSTLQTAGTFCTPVSSPDQIC